MAHLQQTGYRADALIGGFTPRIAKNLVGGQALLDQIIAAHARFGEAGIPAARAGGDHQRRQAFLFEIESVVEPRLEYRGRLAVVFSSAEYHDRVGGRRLVERSLAANGSIKQDLKSYESADGQKKASQKDPMDSGSAVQPMNSFNCSRVMGPSRRT